MHHSHIGIKARLGVFLHDSGKTADLTVEAGPGNLPDAVEFALGRYRKTSLDDIYTELIKLPGDHELFVRGERHARSLFAVTKSCIKNADLFTNKRANVVEDDSPQRFLVSYSEIDACTIKHLPIPAGRGQLIEQSH